MKTIYFEIMDGFGIMFGWKRPKRNNKWKFHKIKASEGHMLTNGEICAKVVYVASKEEQSQWHEITEEDYRAQFKKEAMMLENNSV